MSRRGKESMDKDVLLAVEDMLSIMIDMVKIHPTFDPTRDKEILRDHLRIISDKIRDFE